jgi:hypothetical protein
LAPNPCVLDYCSPLATTLAASTLLQPALHSSGRKQKAWSGLTSKFGVPSFIQVPARSWQNMGSPCQWSNNLTMQTRLLVLIARTVLERRGETRDSRLWVVQAYSPSSWVVSHKIRTYPSSCDRKTNRPRHVSRDYSGILVLIQAAASCELRASLTYAGDSRAFGAWFDVCSMPISNLQV